MRSSAARRSRQSGSVLILFTFMLPFLLIPMVGLAIDSSLARIVQLRLQAAVDGAATGAGRVLGVVPDNKVETLALEFVKSNFYNDNKNGTWGAHNLVCVPGTDIVYTPGITKKISVSAKATVPLLFMRIFNFSEAVVASIGIATRTDARIMFVLDRSGSMNTSDGAGSTVIADAKANAITFLSNFRNGTDEVGLVVFDSGGVVGYPTYSAGGWSSAIPTAAPYGGPDTNFANGATTDMPHQINNVAANGGTGMAEAISIAYIELQKAHLRDLADPLNHGTDTRLNTIVLLTDGVPTAISLYLNDPNKVDGIANHNNIVQGTNCTYKTINPPTPSASNMMRGVFVITGSPPFTNTGTVGMYLMPGMDTANGSTWWMSHAGQTLSPPANPFAGTGCAGLKASSDPEQTYFTGHVPSTDVWGNSIASPTDIVTNTVTGYINSHIVGGSTSSVYNGTNVDRTQTGLRKNYNWGLLMWNSVDTAALRIRTDANKVNRIGDSDPAMKIGFEVIGYTGNGGVDTGLLMRVANDTRAVGFSGSQPNGSYYSAANNTELTAAFTSVAADILRLAR